jgi:hypothetical protein
MKMSRNLIGIVSASLLIAASALAGNTNKSSLHLDETVTVAGRQLPAGDYRVEWEGSGPNVQLSISSHSQTPVQVPARVVPETVSNQGNAFSTTDDKDGTKVLTTIYPDGKKFDLEIGSQAGAATPPSGANGNN